MAQTRRKPGPPRTLTEAEIVNAALALLDAGGPEAASIRRVAAAVAVAPNAVYTYFPDKAALGRAVVERVLADVTGAAGDPAAGDPAAGDPAAGDPAAGDPAGGAPAGGDPTGDDPAGGVPAGGDPTGGAQEGGDSPAGWRDRVEALAVDLRRQLIAHPGTVPLMLAGPMDGPHALRLGERLLEQLADGGLDPASAARAAYLLKVFVLGTVGLEVADVPPGMLPPEAERIAARRAVLGEVTASAFPRTAAVAGALAACVGAEQFRWGLRRLLDGLATDPKPATELD